MRVVGLGRAGKGRGSKEDRWIGGVEQVKVLEIRR